MLPNAVASRLSLVPSLRRTLSDYGIRSKAKQQDTDMVLHRRAESTDVLLGQVPAESSQELKGKLSMHGYNLLQASLAESQASHPDSRAFSRQLYLDSVSYLLQGLPSDLSGQEVIHIQKAIPVEIQGPQVLEGRSIRQQPSKPPSILHRSLASTIICLCVILRLFLPYLKYFAAAAYRYDRTYHISERVFATTMSTTDTLGKRAIEVASTALGSEFVMEGVSYCVEGVCGGVTEGLGEGMKGIEGTERC